LSIVAVVEGDEDVDAEQLAVDVVDEDHGDRG
jgi:hypothetical protein